MNDKNNKNFMDFDMIMDERERVTMDLQEKGEDCNETQITTEVERCRSVWQNLDKDWAIGLMLWLGKTTSERESMMQEHEQMETTSSENPFSKEDLFVIETLVRFSVYNKLEQENIITKDVFQDFYEQLSETQKKIANYFLVKEAEMIIGVTEILSSKISSDKNES